VLDGFVDSATRGVVRGWAADIESPDHSIDVSVTVDGSLVGSVRAESPRGDLAALGRYGQGNHGFLFRFTPPLDTEHDHDVMVTYARDGGALRRGKFRIRRERQDTGPLPVIFHQSHSAKRPWRTALPRYVIHVGPPKTGTTYLQRMFWELRGQMRNEGIYYPHEFWPSGANFLHSELVRELRQGPSEKLANVFAALNASGSETVLISCEGFVALPVENLTYLRELLRDASVDIVFYARRWSDWYPSQWQQHIKQGSTEQFPIAYARLLGAKAPGESINHKIALDRFASVFGEKSIKVVSYSNLADARVDIAEHFFSAILGWTPKAFPKFSSPVNSSLSVFETEIVRCLNHLEVIHKGAADVRIYFRFEKMGGAPRFRELMDYLNLAMESSVAQLTIDDSAPRLHAIFEEINRAYAATLVGKEYGDRWFRPRAKASEYIKSDYLLRWSAVSTIRQFYSEMMSNQAAKS
jgi:hypothetical protein